MNNRFPNVLLLGNGINLAYGGISWKELLKGINVRDDLDIDHLTLPMPLQAILLSNNCLKDAMKENNGCFCGEIKTEEQMKVLQELLSFGFDDILTTNYSYELEAAATGREKVSFQYVSRKQDKTSAVTKAESKFMFHTFNHVDFNNVENRIWHIHGESRKPDSMILGHYWYGNMLSRMKSLSDSGKDTFYQKQQTGVEQTYESWLDSFIMGNVYVLGFGFDPSEIDLWWLLNRKKREKAQTGKLYFYEMKSEKSYEKVELMRLLGAEPINFGMIKPEKENLKRDQIYKDFYSMTLADIRKKMEEC